MLIGTSASFEISYFRVTQNDPNFSVFVGTKRYSGGGFYQIAGFNYNEGTARMTRPSANGDAQGHRLQFFAWQKGFEKVRWGNPQGDSLYLETNANGDVVPPTHFQGFSHGLRRLCWYGYYHGACLVQNTCPNNHEIKDIDPWWQAKVVWMPAYGTVPDPVSEPSQLV